MKRFYIVAIFTNEQEMGYTDYLSKKAAIKAAELARKDITTFKDDMGNNVEINGADYTVKIFVQDGGKEWVLKEY